MPPKQLTLNDIHGSDPLSKLLFGLIKLKPHGLVFFFMLTGCMYALIIPYYAGIKPGLDLITVINIILVFPVIGYFYAYQPTSILRTYQSVTRFLKEEGAEIIPFEKLKSLHARPVWWLAGFLIGGISAWFGIQSAMESYGKAWDNINTGQMLLVFGVRFLAMAMIGIIAARHIAASISLNSLFQYAQFPLTLETDQLEVFSATKRFSLEIVGVAAIIGLNLGLQPLVIVVPMAEYMFYVTMYFILAPLTFFLPLWEVHRRMVAIKSKMLEKFHKDFQEESEKLYETISNDPKKDLSNSYLKQSEGLISIKQAIELVNQSPDWPFQGTTIYRMLITIISPFLLVFWDIAINIISNLVVAN